ncbi:MAG TPA: glycosyltransferase family 2 protein [Actinomycetota bacterium]|nr:glycosyltransferase family 2 protein [Actinomycetota bacterium]
MQKISSLSCFFPVFNEEENIGPLLEEALATLPAFAERFEIIVVDDGSTDATPSVVERYVARHPEVRCERHPANLGYGHALQTGLRASRMDAVFFTDGDRQFRIGDLDRLVPRFGPEVPIVVGYRIKRNDPWHRLVVARVYHLVLRAVFDLRLHDVDCAFKLIGRPVLDRFLDDLRSRSAFISPELMIRSREAGYGIVEVGVPHHPRPAGRPKGATPKVIWRTIREIVRMRRELRAGRSTSGKP